MKTKIIIISIIIAAALFFLGKWVTKQSAACEAQWQAAVARLNK